MRHIPKPPGIRWAQGGMIEHNAFCNSEPQEDALCGCVDNYDLTDWNDIEPPDWEGGDAPHQRSCLCNGENGDAYDNRDPDGCRNCCEGESCDGCRDPEMELFIPKASSQQQPESGTQRPIVYNYMENEGSYEEQIIQI